MTNHRDTPRPRDQSDNGRPPKRMSELGELISSALRNADVARDKGFYTVSLEATLCVRSLRRITSLPLDPRLISDSDAFRPLLLLAKNGNPKIRSEAKSVLTHLRSIMSGNHPPDRASGPSSSSCSSRDEDRLEKKRAPVRRTYAKRNNKGSAGRKKRAPPPGDTQEKTAKNNGGSANACSTPEARDDTQKKTPEEHKEEVYAALKEAHEAVKNRVSLSAKESRKCVVTLKGLFLLPQAVTRELLLTTDAGKRMDSLNEHKDPDIQSMAASLLEHWLLFLYHTNRRSRV